jgi:2-polyprenyl-3-methyl-5-hydroxy-6-metoxy-1,4-benzoquinol methylase
MQRSHIYGRDFSAGLNGKYRRVYDLVPHNCRLLELGCSTGYFTEYLAQKGTTVIAVDSDPSAVAACRERGINALQIDLSSSEIDGVLAEHAPFDAVIAMDLLEHLPQPHNLLTRLRNLMHPYGRLFVTGPNVAYWHVRWELLRGRWNYTRAGIMDETHLRWFTRATWRKLLEENGFEIEIDDIAESLLPKEHQLRDALGGGTALKKIKKFTEKAFPDLVATVFLFCCRIR